MYEAVRPLCRNVILLKNNKSVQTRAMSLAYSSMPKIHDIKIVEVGPRDGLQNESHPISVEDKVTFVNRLFETGLMNIEAGAFVSPKWVAQMANSNQVFQNLTFNTIDKPQLSCLVP
jgi:hydroxymethylglutaryl-CoA lyase